MICACRQMKTYISQLRFQALTTQLCKGVGAACPEHFNACLHYEITARTGISVNGDHSKFLLLL